MSKKSLLLFIIILCGPFTTQAEDLLSIYQSAQTNDPTVQAAKAARLAALEAKPQAGAQFLPSISATTAHTGNHTNHTGGSATSANGQTVNNASFGSSHYKQSTYGLSLTQPIFYYKEWVQYKRANEQTKQANANYAAAEQDLIVRTTQRYFNVLKAIDALNFAKANQIAIAKFLEQTEQRFKVGLIAITDVQIARAQHDSAYADQLAAENAVADQKELLREITGRPIDNFSFLRDELSLKSPEPADMEKWVTTALEQNFSLEAARLGVEASRTDIRLTQGGHLPTVNLNSAVNYSTTTPATPSATNSTIGLQVSVPLFNGGGITSKTRQAMHTYQQTQKQMEALYRQIESNTRQSYRGVLTQLSQMNALKQAIISNNSALQATQAAFNVGTRTIVDVLNAQSSLIDAKRNHANARYDYILKSVQLKQAAGTLSPEDVRHINAWLTHSENLMLKNNTTAPAVISAPRPPKAASKPAAKILPKKSKAPEKNKSIKPSVKKKPAKSAIKPNSKTAPLERSILKKGPA